MKYLFCFVICIPTLLYGQVKDVDDNVYTTTKIGNQEWLVQDLKVTHFQNGDQIHQAKTYQEWNQAAKAQKPAWCYYMNDAKNGAKYGVLYNWYAVNDSRGLAPKGWRIASLEDWNALITELGSYHEGDALKSLSGWSERHEPTNETGFSALPSGWRDWELTIEEDHGFDFLGEVVQWWTSTNVNKTEAIGMNLGYCVGYNIGEDEDPKGNGAYIRCIKQK
ncbi:MAG: hypothetical protein GY810_07350 [Aureispira sp.]|nr:hypothetical protein [Aureispira sp.]